MARGGRTRNHGDSDEAQGDDPGEAATRLRPRTEGGGLPPPVFIGTPTVPRLPLGSAGPPHTPAVPGDGVGRTAEAVGPHGRVRGVVKRISGRVGRGVVS